jgi:hypothetical protein
VLPSGGCITHFELNYLNKHPGAGNIKLKNLSSGGKTVQVPGSLDKKRVKKVTSFIKQKGESSSAFYV